MLELHEVHTYYGDSYILRGISFAVGAGECVALLGRNGAGKTTILRSALGLSPIRRGSIIFQGQEISAEPTYRIVRRGIGYVPDNRGIFGSVTVEEHLALAERASRTRSGRYSIRSIFELFPSLERRRKSYGSQLSGGEQQMLALGRALVSNPVLLVLDEPSEGLAPAIIDVIEDVLRAVYQDGTSILLVEQDYYLATALATKLFVLSQGEFKFNGTPDALMRNEHVKSTYLSI